MAKNTFGPFGRTPDLSTEHPSTVNGTDEEASGMSGGATAGITIASLLGVAALAGLIYYFLLRGGDGAKSASNKGASGKSKSNKSKKGKSSKKSGKAAK